MPPESKTSISNRNAHTTLKNAIALDLGKLFKLDDIECLQAALDCAKQHGSSYALLQTGLRRQITWFKAHLNLLASEIAKREDRGIHRYICSWLEAEDPTDNEPSTAIGLLVSIYWVEVDDTE